LYGRQPIFVLAISLLSGLFAVFGGASPTGSDIVDLLFVFGAATAVTWAAGTAPWWAVCVACGIAAAAATPDWLLVFVGVEGAALAAFIGANRRNQPWARSLAAFSAVQVFARLDLGGFLGLSALLACATLGVVFVLGVQRRPGRVRLRTWRVVAGVGVVAFGALLGIGLAGIAARGPLEQGNRQARAGLKALDRGDFAAATKAFRGAANSFARADDDLGALWGQPARFLPVVAQNREGAITVAGSGASAMRAAAEAVGKIDPASVRVVDGRIDIDSVRALEQPFTDIRTAIDLLGVDVASVRSPWLVEPFRVNLDELSTDISNNSVRAGTAIEAVRLAPDMLGASGVRRYFIAFTTPAEARGLGGFMGNYAEITVDEGRIEMTQFGRHTDLTQGSAGSQARTLTMAPDVAGAFGPYLLAGDSGAAAGDIWRLLTMVPDFPTVAQFMAELYPQSGGGAVDGVFVLDPEAVAAIIGLTGPIRVDGVAKPITEKNAAQFIIEDQYKVQQQGERIDLLEAIARTTVEQLLSGTLPAPNELARVFGPLAADDRFMAWSNNVDEEALFSKVGMSGQFPQLSGGDGVAVTVDNGGANKIDAYLDVAVEYQRAPPGPDGRTVGTVTVTITNSAPAAGLPGYVIGNAFGLPLGTNRMLLSIYTALDPGAETVAGEPVELVNGEVFGWNVSRRFLDVPPGESRTVTLTVSGYLPSPDRPLVTRLQPLVRLPEFTATKS